MPPPPLSSLKANWDLLIPSELDKDEDWLSVVELEDLSPAQHDARQVRITQLQEVVRSDTRAQWHINNIHNELSSQAPSTLQEQKEMQKYLAQKKWPALLYVCNDLMMLPSQLQLQSLIKKHDVTKSDMAEGLVQWVRCFQL